MCLKNYFCNNISFWRTISCRQLKSDVQSFSSPLHFVSQIIRHNNKTYLKAFQQIHQIMLLFDWKIKRGLYTSLRLVIAGNCVNLRDK